ncbi:hypothetical protein [Arthrospiribacter ruber]|uniref:Uncharacterized protein n=1 Tax=Arthrospiribacter ruber TaxID=2487934 RepID=A0A951J5U5_9BACT|nr:hypothetical protein [Arthrospiribacter ruber]MBW3470073.1 hypothetical protein [Arthrospiribacter ruber]
MFHKNLIQFIILALTFGGCKNNSDVPREIYSNFKLDLTSNAFVSDIEISENKVFFFTNKHELLTYNYSGNFLLDTVISPPKLFPNGSVEAYNNNYLGSIFYFNNAIYSLGNNPSDLYRFDLESRGISQKRIEIAGGGLYDILSTDSKRMLVSFWIPSQTKVQFFNLNFPNLRPTKVAELSPTSNKNTFASFYYKEKIYLLEALGKGIWEINRQGKVRFHESYFLDSVLFKGKLKGVKDLNEFSGLKPWERNQYFPDEILSVIKLREDCAYFLVKKLNRTMPDSSDYNIVLYRLSADNFSQKNLDRFLYAKLDTKTQSFFGVTNENRFFATSNLDSLINSK